MKKYKIRKGKNSSRPRLIKFWRNKKEFNFSFILTTSCWYPKEVVSIPGISKIGGVSFGIHAEDLGPFNKIIPRRWINSLVIGWKPSEEFGTFDLFGINDNKGVETRPKLNYKIKAGQKINVRIVKYNEFVLLHINGKLVKTIILNGNINFGYYLGFYHGGKDAAYWDMTSYLEIK